MYVVRKIRVLLQDKHVLRGQSQYHRYVATYNILCNSLFNLLMYIHSTRLPWKGTDSLNTDFCKGKLLKTSNVIYIYFFGFI